MNYRSQCRKCGARRVDRQIGLEGSIEAYVDVMVRVFREVKRVLRDDGTAWINLGDSYANIGGGAATSEKQSSNIVSNGKRSRPEPGLAPKNLLGMPWRVAFALQADGWVLRSAITWCKGSPMPESCTDRPTSATEMLFLLAKQSTYYYDQEATRVPSAAATLQRDKNSRIIKYGISKGQYACPNDHESISNPAGRSLWNYWIINSEPYVGSHFATFPRKLVEPCVKAGSSERGCCPRCGAGWVRRVEDNTGGSIGKGSWIDHANDSTNGQVQSNTRVHSGSDVKTYRRGSTLGWHASCQCPPHAPVPAIILDPFCGSGTVMVVANALGRRGIGLDLSREYLTNQAQRRLERPHAAPLRPARVEPALPLFGDIDP